MRGLLGPIIVARYDIIVLLYSIQTDMAFDIIVANSVHIGANLLDWI